MLCLLGIDPGASIIRKWGWKAMLQALKNEILKMVKLSQSFRFWLQ